MLARCVATLKPPPELTLSQWADRYRMLSAESSAEPGRWHTDKAPYQREIMDAIGDAHIRRVVIMCAAQLGKTELLLNILGYFMAYAPAPILVMQPTLDMGQTFSKDRLAPMIRDTPVLRGLVDVKSRYAGNTILKKNFPGGHITIVGANSATGLASRPIKVLLADEVDRYPGSAGTEGDPLSLAQKRQTTFWDKKTVMVSTPVIKGHSRIIAELETVTEMQARVIKIMATRLAELGDTVTGRDEIAQADKAYRDAIGGDEWPDWAEQGGEDDGEPYHTGGA